MSAWADLLRRDVSAGCVSRQAVSSVSALRKDIETHLQKLDRPLLGPGG
jgi:hypothetical protein